MKIGIISDIHGNLYSLMEVYSLLEREGVDSIICLGDMVGYGPHPNEVINFIRRKQIISLKGVYDLAVLNNDFTYIKENTINNFSVEFTREELTKNNIYYLLNLPTELNMKFGNFKIKFIHKNPYENVSQMEEDILVCGCTHMAEENKILKNKYILNPGSVGRLSYNNEIVTFGVLEISENLYNFKIMNSSYSFQKIQKDMKMMKFPEMLINSYDTGTN